MCRVSIGPLLGPVLCLRKATLSPMKETAQLNMTIYKLALPLAITTLYKYHIYPVLIVSSLLVLAIYKVAKWATKVEIDDQIAPLYFNQLHLLLFAYH
jgi:hypothetical protein